MSLEACPLLSIPITQFSTMYLKHLQILELVSELWKYQPIPVVQGTKYSEVTLVETVLIDEADDSVDVDIVIECTPSASDNGDKVHLPGPGGYRSFVCPATGLPQTEHLLAIQSYRSLR